MGAETGQGRVRIPTMYIYKQEFHLIYLHMHRYLSEALALGCPKR